MRAIKLYFLSAFLIMIFSQCHKCHDTQLDSMAFSQEDLNINPYKATDNVTFIGKRNDTLIYSGKREMKNIIVTEYGTMDDELALYGCWGQWYNSQENSTQLSIKDKSDIEIYLSLPNFHSGNSEKLRSFVVSIPDKSVAGFGVVLTFENGKIMNPDETSEPKHLEAFLDSVIIGPSVYHNVYKMFADPGSYEQTKYDDWIQRVYYSIPEGVVGFTLKSNKYYYLAKHLKQISE
jgi:hypothetical protein